MPFKRGTRVATAAADKLQDVAEDTAFSLLTYTEDKVHKLMRSAKRLGDTAGMLSNLALAIIFIVYASTKKYANDGRVNVYCAGVEEGAVTFSVCDTFHNMVVLGFASLLSLVVRLLTLKRTDMPLYSMLNAQWFTLVFTSGLYATYLFANNLSYTRNAYMMAAAMTFFGVAGCNALQRQRVSHKYTEDAMSVASGVLTFLALAIVLYAFAGDEARNGAVVPSWQKYQRWAFLASMVLLLGLSVLPTHRGFKYDPEAKAARSSVHEHNKWHGLSLLGMFLQWSLVMPYLHNAKM